MRADRSGIAAVAAEGEKATNNLVDDIAADARRYVPVLTGATRDGIEAEHAVDGKARVSVTRQGQPGDDPDIPIYLELGTSQMGAQPYLRPALYQRRALR
jgi:hypothetical protein